MSLKFTNETSHIIIGSNELTKDEEQTFLLGIAHRINIVTFDWVLTCLQKQEIVPTVG